MKLTIALSVLFLLVLSLFAFHALFSVRESPPPPPRVTEDTHPVNAQTENTRRLAYIVSDSRIPFWDIMRRGIVSAAEKKGYVVSVHSAGNERRIELEAIAKVISEGVDGVIVSPTSSAACATLLSFANKAGIPVVIADIGTEGGDYVSYIASDNQAGAHEIGKALYRALMDRGWEISTVGIVAIPQTRLNGQARTAGFMEALEGTQVKVSGIQQQETWTEQETYDFTKDFISQDENLRAIWLQGSNRYNGALRAIADAGKRGKILLVTFDAEPEFIEMIQEGTLLGAAMQQPFRMGEEAVQALTDHLEGKKVAKTISIPMLTISQDNIQQELPLIKRNVLGLEDPLNGQ